MTTNFISCLDSIDYTNSIVCFDVAFSWDMSFIVENTFLELP